MGKGGKFRIEGQIYLGSVCIKFMEKSVEYVKFIGTVDEQFKVIKGTYQAGKKIEDGFEARFTLQTAATV